MEKLMIGIDLCDVYTQAAVVGRETAWSLPTVICRKKSAEEWHIGEDAYRYTLLGEGVIVDKLLSLTAKDGTATIQGVKYRGMELPGRTCNMRRSFGGFGGQASHHWSYRMFCLLCFKPAP